MVLVVQVIIENMPRKASLQSVVDSYRREYHRDVLKNVRTRNDLRYSADRVNAYEKLEEAKLGCRVSCLLMLIVTSSERMPEKKERGT